MLKERLNKAYDQLPKMDASKCQGICNSGKCKHECCTVTACSPTERHLINRAVKILNGSLSKTAKLPFVKMEFGHGFILPNSKNSPRFEFNKPDVKCAYSTEAGCIIYAERPMVCRLFGSCKQMPCTHFPEEAKDDIPFEKMVDIGYFTPEEFKDHESKVQEAFKMAQRRLAQEKIDHESKVIGKI